MPARGVVAAVSDGAFIVGEARRARARLRDLLALAGRFVPAPAAGRSSAARARGRRPPRTAGGRAASSRFWSGGRFWYSCQRWRTSSFLSGGSWRMRLVLLARGGALLRRQLGPGLHLLLDALLLVGAHLGVALRDAAPLLLALRVHVAPVGRERAEHLLFLGRELRPRGRPHRDLRERDGRHEGEDHEQGNRGGGCPDHGSRRVSQFWKPRSR